MMATNRCAWIVAVVGLAPAAWMTDVLVRAHRTYRTRVAAEWRDRGEDALRRQDATEAVTDFRAAAQLAPHSVTIGLRLAAALASMNRLDDARREVSALREIDPTSGPVNLALARLAVNRRETASALAFYDAAIKGRWDENTPAERAIAERERQRVRVTIDRTPAQP
jgi:Flp pilus assembly protein TadD